MGVFYFCRMTSYSSELFSVAGRRVVVTGGGRGIGLMIVESFLKAGAEMVFIVSRNRKVIEPIANEFNRKFPQQKCFGIVADLSDEDEILKAIQQIEVLSKHIDILVNNSGCNWGEAIETYPNSAWDKVLNLNVKSVFLLTRGMLPLLAANATQENPSRVINIGSVDGVRVPALDTFAYSASKAAVHQLTRVLAAKLGSRKITVNGIVAGPFPSKMMKQTLENHGDKIIAGTVLNRVGRADDIGGLCIYLGSRASSWMTGAIIPLDGGVLIAARM